MAIVVPVYNDSLSLIELIQQLAAVLRNQITDVALVIVDDGSAPSIVDSFHNWSDIPFDGRILTLKRNCGHQRAIAIGLAYAVENDLADIVLVMDADGEDKPEDVPRLIAAIGDRGSSIAVGQRSKRSEDMVFRIFYQCYRLMFLLLTGHRIGFGNFLALPLSCARRIVNMGELWPESAGDDPAFTRPNRQRSVGAGPAISRQFANRILLLSSFMACVQ